MKKLTKKTIIEGAGIRVGSSSGYTPRASSVGSRR